MSRMKLVAPSLCFVLALAMWVPRAHADEWNQATKLTFNQPVEIPGRVLAAGTYWFTLSQGDTDRNLVQVWGPHRQHLITTVLTIPDMRMHHVGRLTVNFAERPTGTPEALRAWFYPGMEYGHEFVYPESRAKEIAKQTGHPVLSMRDDMADNMKKPIHSTNDSAAMALRHADIQAVNSNGQVVDKSQAMEGTGNNSQMASQH